MLSINPYSETTPEQERYKAILDNLESKELETLDIILRHRDDEIYERTNLLSMHNDKEPALFLRDKKYVINSAQCTILDNMISERNSKMGIWPRKDLLNEIYCLLKEKQPGYKNPQLEDWLARRQGSFTKGKQEVQERADVVKVMNKFCNNAVVQL